MCTDRTYTKTLTYSRNRFGCFHVVEYGSSWKERKKERERKRVWCLTFLYVCCRHSIKSNRSNDWLSIMESSICWHLLKMENTIITIRANPFGHQTSSTELLGGSFHCEYCINIFEEDEGRRNEPFHHPWYYKWQWHTHNPSTKWLSFDYSRWNCFVLLQVLNV